VKNIGYVRVSSKSQNLDVQRNMILEYSKQNKIELDEIIEIEISGIASNKKRMIDTLLEKLSEGGTLIISELSRLGRNTFEILNIIDNLTKNNVNIIFIMQPELSITSEKRELLIPLYSQFAELERKFIIDRTHAGLEAAKLKGVKLGRPKGSKSLKISPFEKHKSFIEKHLEYDIPLNTILKMINHDNNTKMSYTAFRYYIEHNIKL